MHTSYTNLCCATLQCYICSVLLGLIVEVYQRTGGFTLSVDTADPKHVIYVVQWADKEVRDNTPEKVMQLVLDQLNLDQR